MNTKLIKHTTTSSFSQKLKDYEMLVKLRLNLLVVFTSLIAFFLASEGDVSWYAVLLLAAGGFLVTGAANTLNEVLERDFDKLMKRTENRPLAAGRMTVSEAILAAGFMSFIGISFLAFFNPLTAVLGMLSLICYAFIYTPLKRVTPLAVLVGAIPGALPTMIGCVAAQGELTALALVLFGIQFFWQFPHFWAIAWVGHEDYTKAGYYLLPSRSGERNSETGKHAFTYAFVLIPIGVLPWYLGVSGIVSMMLMVLLSVIYAFFAWQLYKKCTKEAALKLMFSSFFYLPLALLFLLIDKL